MRIHLLSLMLLAWLTAFCSPAQAAAKIEHWQTPQGSRVYYVHTEGLPMVDIQVAFDAGSARDESQFGLSALTSGLLDTGAGQWNADEIAQRFESVGAQFGSNVSNDMASVSLRTLTEKPLFDKALETMQVILTSPRFNEADFQREKNRTLSGLKQQEESPGELAGIAFYKALYGDHPYGHPTPGSIATVSGLGVADLRSFYQKYYVAANAMVVIVGDLTRQQAEQTAE
ncbi:MAG: M16 family metallopeptidase, partial [Methylobacter sp.]